MQAVIDVQVVPENNGVDRKRADLTEYIEVDVHPVKVEALQRLDQTWPLLP